jgi:hypothetical protein
MQGEAMTHDKPDYERVLALLQTTPGRYYPTWDIAQRIGSQHNSVQRALHQLRVDRGLAQIVSRPHAGTQVKEYAWCEGLTLRAAWRQVDAICPHCRGSFYQRLTAAGWACNLCGEAAA